MTDRSLALIGYGRWGRNLARNFAGLGALSVICESGEDRAAEARQALPDIPVDPDLDRVLADSAIEAVVIATPAATHGDIVGRALEAGKHVYVEKPLCLDLAEADRLVAKAEAAGRVLMVGHLMLYHGAFRALCDLVRGGGLGKLRYIYSNRLNLGMVRTEENALWSFAPHDISMILALVGKAPRHVTATGGCYLSPDIADTTVSAMHFDENVIAHIFVSWLHPYKEQRLVVIGEDAMATFNDTAPEGEKLLLFRHEFGWNGAVPTWSKAEAEPIPYEAVEPLRTECQAFLDAVAGRAAPPSDGAEGRRVLSVLAACQESLGANGAPVDLEPAR